MLLIKLTTFFTIISLFHYSISVEKEETPIPILAINYLQTPCPFKVHYNEYKNSIIEIKCTGVCKNCTKGEECVNGYEEVITTYIDKDNFAINTSRIVFVGCFKWKIVSSQLALAERPSIIT